MPLHSHWTNTMYRCLLTAAALAMSISASAQVQRGFPQKALRGTIDFGVAPEILLNGKPARMSPGTRIRGLDNMLVMPGNLTGAKKVAVNYTFENTTGLVQDIWLLRKEEAARKPWPATPQEAAAWSFDPAAQTWTKP
jgi:hypothetical protein